MVTQSPLDTHLESACCRRRRERGPRPQHGRRHHPATLPGEELPGGLQGQVPDAMRFGLGTGRQLTLHALVIELFVVVLGPKLTLHKP